MCFCSNIGRLGHDILAQPRQRISRPQHRMYGRVCVCVVSYALMRQQGCRLGDFRSLFDRVLELQVDVDLKL